MDAWFDISFNSLKLEKINTMRKKFESSEYTQAPLQLEFSRMIQATPNEVWRLLSDHKALSNWIPHVKSSSIVDKGYNNEEKQGTLRKVQFGKDVLNETIVFWDETFGYAYSIADMHIVKNHVGHFSITEKMDGTLLSWSQYYEPQGNAIKRWMAKNIMLPGVMKKALKNIEKSILTSRI